MMTTTHVLMAAAATTRPKMPGWLITVGWLGGFFPDASMFAMVAASRMGMTASDNLWRQPGGMYWTDPWQSLIDYSHSIPLWSLLCVAGLLIWKQLTGRAQLAGFVLLIFGVGALMHSFVDLATHVDDAHAHFRPFTDWRFSSPISYYRRDHYGQWVSLFESVVGCGIAVWIVLCFRQIPVRLLAVLLILPYLMRFWFLFAGYPGGGMG